MSSRCRLLHVVTALVPLAGYLEWGQGQRAFLLLVERDILLKIFRDPFSVAHPLILLPLSGQILLVCRVLFPGSPRMVSWAGIACIAVLMGMLLVVGVISGSLPIFASTLPFWIAAYLLIRYCLNQRLIHSDKQGHD